MSGSNTERWKVRRKVIAVLGLLLASVPAGAGTAPSEWAEPWEGEGNATDSGSDAPPDRTVLKLVVAGGVFMGLMLLGLVYCLCRYYQFAKEEEKSKEAFTEAFSEKASLSGGAAASDVELKEINVDYVATPSTASLANEKKKKAPGSWREAAGFSDVSTPIWLGPKRGHSLSVNSTAVTNNPEVQTLRSSFRSPPNSGSTCTTAMGTITVPSRQGGSGSSSMSLNDPARGTATSRSRNVTFLGDPPLRTASSSSILKPPPSSITSPLLSDPSVSRSNSKPLIKAASSRALTTSSSLL
eukprot:TRINITY_DN26864_c0_g1_i1.p1 TRINITY_DN26864_c0_g1~~TRINITY_DN26864_c0_g1_i1.p1  ORF type:complete len:298 (+),score=37.05 TRINITY_DN26864_c0_g1_i1:31-924(+)